jgi:3-hydroxybutyryl-CoA dehydrogenase
MSYEIKTVGVIGAGLMGSGIAEVCALAGIPTVLVKATAGSPAKALDKIRASMDARVQKGKLDAAAATAALACLTVTSDLDAVVGCDLVIESIVEDLATKRALFESLAPRLAPHAVLATNTSTLKVTELAAGIREARTIGLHFFSPVPMMTLVELAHTAATDADIVPAAEAFIAKLGKVAVPVLDSTGFVVNRLLVPMLLNAIHAYEHGLASADQIDTAMKLGCGHPMGPLALADLIGLDVVYAMAKLLYRDFGDACYRAPALLRRLVQEGQLGKKAGRGFYDYSARPPRPSAIVVDLIRGGALRQAA